MTFLAPPALVAIAGVVGLLVGSFLNVVIWRVPRGESVVTPPSACPNCGSPIAPYDNDPVLSWLVLRGRCRRCRGPVSVRYPLVELGTGLGFAAVAWWLGWSWALPVHLVLVALTVALSMIDLDVHRLPDAIVLPSYPVALAGLALAAGGTGDWGSLGRAVIGGVVLFVAYFAMRLAYPKGMGFGDVKLAGILGLVLAWWGWPELVVGFFAAFVLGGVFSLALMLAGRAGRASKVPFGPWMFLGAWVGITGGGAVVDGYLGLFMS